MSFDVFISYAHDDKPVADAACAIIEKSGIRCWIAPRDIAPGMDYATALIEALEACKALVLIFSGHANESPHIRREVERAVSRGIPLIPVRIEDIQPSAALKYFVSSVHWLDALTPPLERHFENLATNLGAILGRERPDTSTQALQNTAAAAPHPVLVPNKAMARRLFRARAAGIGCFATGGITMLWLVLLHDTVNLLLSVCGTTMFYFLVFRNLTRDLRIALPILAALTAFGGIYVIGLMMQNNWLFVPSQAGNVLFASWMLYEVNAMAKTPT